MHPAAAIAMGYRYPAPGSLETLSSAVKTLSAGAAKRHLTRFVVAVDALPIEAWEELHTATLDLSPQFVPYVGHVMWGENYRRGEFMADLNGAMRTDGVDLDGELPDHIAPVLRYLSVTANPFPDLTDVLAKAVEAMTDTLAKAAPDNPYRHLLAATADYAADLPVRPDAARGDYGAWKDSPEGTPVQVGRKHSDE